MGRHRDAFADIFVAHTGIHIPTLHEMCRETLNLHIGTGTSNLNVQIVFVSSFYVVYFTSVLFWRIIRWRHALNANVWQLPVTDYAV